MPTVMDSSSVARAVLSTLPIQFILPMENVVRQEPGTVLTLSLEKATVAPQARPFWEQLARSQLLSQT
jgi:hypothetical protein